MVITGNDAWVDKLGRKDMPVLAAVVKELNDLTGSDETEVNQLADAILKDPNLTSQVLRIANSVHFNASSYPISTISRAIVLIGFRGVRAICVSVMMIDTLLGKEPKERLLQQMAQSFHAAVQARNLVKGSKLDVQEEVFIAALLFNLGAMAFWGSGGDAVHKVEELLALDRTLSQRDAVERVTGTSFKGISRGLADIWNLGDTLKQALNPDCKPSLSVQAVILGEEISQAALKGWDSAEIQAVLKKLATFTGHSESDCLQGILASADESAEVAVTYGAAKVCHLIPTSHVPVTQSPSESSSAFKPNPSLQLSVLRDLSSAVQEAFDVNTVFQMVLEGLHRGVGLERVALAFIQQDALSVKYVLGEGTQKWRRDFNFPLKTADDNIFAHAIKKGEPVWISDAELPRLAYMYSQPVREVVGCMPAFMSVVRLGNRDVALIYADRWKLGGQLDDDQFQSFRHFILQTQMCLQMLAQKRK